MKKLVYTILLSSILFSSGLRFSVDGLGVHQLHIDSNLLEKNVDYGMSLGYELDLFQSEKNELEFGLGLEFQIPREINNTESDFGFSSIYIKTNTNADKTYYFLNLGLILFQTSNDEYRNLFIGENSGRFKTFKYDLGVGHKFKKGTIELKYVNNSYTLKSESSNDDLYSIFSIYDKYVSLTFMYDIFN